MVKPRKIGEQPCGKTAPIGAESELHEESLGEQLMSEARQGHADFVGGWTRFMEQLGIRGHPMGAKQLRALLIQAGIKADANEFSRGILAMREE